MRDHGDGGVHIHHFDVSVQDIGHPSVAPRAIRGIGACFNTHAASRARECAVLNRDIRDPCPLVVFTAWSDRSTATAAKLHSFYQRVIRAKHDQVIPDTDVRVVHVQIFSVHVDPVGIIGLLHLVIRGWCLNPDVSDLQFATHSM